MYTVTSDGEGEGDISHDERDKGAEDALLARSTPVVDQNPEADDAADGADAMLSQRFGLGCKRTASDCLATRDEGCLSIGAVGARRLSLMRSTTVGARHNQWGAGGGVSTTGALVSLMGGTAGSHVRHSSGMGESHRTRLYAGGAGRLSSMVCPQTAATSVLQMGRTVGRGVEGGAIRSALNREIVRRAHGGQSGAATHLIRVSRRKFLDAPEEQQEVQPGNALRGKRPLGQHAQVPRDERGHGRLKDERGLGLLRRRERQVVVELVRPQVLQARRAVDVRGDERLAMQVPRYGRLGVHVLRTLRGRPLGVLVRWDGWVVRVHVRDIERECTCVLGVGEDVRRVCNHNKT